MPSLGSSAPLCLLRSPALAAPTLTPSRLPVLCLAPPLLLRDTPSFPPPPPAWILLPAPIFGRIPDAYRPRFLISTHFFTSESARPRCHPPNSPTGPLPVDGTALAVTVLCLCLRRPRALSPAPSIRHHCCTKDPDLRPQPLALPAVAPTSPPWVLEPSPGFPLSALSSSLSLLFEISESPESLLFPLPFLSLTSVPSFPSSPHWAPRWSF